MLGRRWLAIWVHSDSLIKNLTPLENNAEIRLLNFPMYANNSQKIHSKLISTLQFLSNWKTMFWVISQEQHSIKTLEFTETNSYFYSFTYEKNIFSSSFYQWVDFFVNLLADRRAVDSTPTYSLLACHTNQASIFSSRIRYKWVNSIDWSTKLSPVFYLFHHGKNWKVQPRTTIKIPLVNLCVNWGK